MEMENNGISVLKTLLTGDQQLIIQAMLIFMPVSIAI